MKYIWKIQIADDLKSPRAIDILTIRANDDFKMAISHARLTKDWKNFEQKNGFAFVRSVEYCGRLSN